MSEDKQRAIEALERAGFKPNGPFRWSRPNMAQQEWVSNDTASLLPYDDGQKHLATIAIYANAEQVPALLAPGYTPGQVEGATRSLVRLMNFALRSARVDYQFDEGDAWSDMQKRLAVTWGAPGKRCDLNESKEVSP